MPVVRMSRGVGLYVIRPKELCRECGDSLYKTKLTGRVWCRTCREYKDVAIWRMFHGEI